MWSLPEINAINAQAAANAAKLRRQIRRGPSKQQKCEVYGCEEHATKSHPWFDTFSDDPKGLVHVCPDHVAEDVEEMFCCGQCNRLMCDHYTWERYRVELDGRVLCLKCAAEEYFEDQANWIDPKLVKEVGFDRNGAPLFNKRTGFLNLARCRHVLGVKQPLPQGIEFVANMEFDSEDCRQISGLPPVALIQQLDCERFCPVLDGAYQFAVSIGLYVRNGQHQAHMQKEAA